MSVLELCTHSLLIFSTRSMHDSSTNGWWSLPTDLHIRTSNFPETTSVSLLANSEMYFVNFCRRAVSHVVIVRLIHPAVIRFIHWFVVGWLIYVWFQSYKQLLSSSFAPVAGIELFSAASIIFFVWWVARCENARLGLTQVGVNPCTCICRMSFRTYSSWRQHLRSQRTLAIGDSRSLSS